jgi:pyrroline-5-carboxylate reductase
MSRKIAILGVGRLGEAVLAGLLRAAIPELELTGTAEPAERARQLAEQYGIQATTDNAVAVEGASLVLIAVPPEAVTVVAGQIGSALAPETVVVSLAAGVPLDVLEHHLPPGTPVVRGMTNSAVQVHQAATALSAGIAVTEDQMDDVWQLFDRLGAAVRVPEPHLDVVTAVAGSGVAFVYHQAAAMIAAAVAEGMAPGAAWTLVVQTVYGAAITLSNTGADPAELADEVATPGGTTQAGLEVLDRHHVTEAIGAAIQAATRRGRELGGSLSRLRRPRSGNKREKSLTGELWACLSRRARQFTSD